MTPSVQEIIPTRPAFHVHDANPVDELQRRKCNKRMNPIRLDHNRVYDKIGAIKVNPWTIFAAQVRKDFEALGTGRQALGKDKKQ